MSGPEYDRSQYYLQQNYFAEGKLRSLHIMKRQGDAGPVKDGVSIEWNEDGSIKLLVEYRDGKPHGVYLIFGSKNALMGELHMAKGVSVGRVAYFNADGSCFSIGSIPDSIPPEFSKEGRAERFGNST